MSIPGTCLKSRGEPQPYDAPDMGQIPDVARCECCGKPLDRDDEEIQVDARDFANWMAALWLKDHRMAGLAFARISLPQSPLSGLASLVGCSKPTATRLWQRLKTEYPQLADFIRGAEKRGGDHRNTPAQKETP